jgi:predicted nucleic acid-binding protein
LIDALRGPGNPFLARVLRAGYPATTVISVFELARGAPNEEQLSRVVDLLADIEILVLDAPSALLAAAVDSELGRSGIRIDTRDTLIAGIALRHDLPLVTRNIRHFERIRGLRLERPD